MKNSFCKKIALQASLPLLILTASSAFADNLFEGHLATVNNDSLATYQAQIEPLRAALPKGARLESTVVVLDGTAQWGETANKVRIHIGERTYTKQAYPLSQVKNMPAGSYHAVIADNKVVGAANNGIICTGGIC